MLFQRFLEWLGRHLPGCDVHDPRKLFVYHLVLLSTLQIACDELRDVRNHRYIQGCRRARRGSGGMPLLRAAMKPRPQILHRELPEGTVEDWVQRFEDEGLGHVTRTPEEASTEDPLSLVFEGEAFVLFLLFCIYSDTISLRI